VVLTVCVYHLQTLSIQITSWLGAETQEGPAAPVNISKYIVLLLIEIRRFISLV
jgi:hypothetical protein